MNHFYLEIMLQERRKEMLKEGRRLRLVSLYNKANRLQLSARLQLTLGAWFIRIGTKMYGRASSHMTTTQQILQSQ